MTPKIAKEGFQERLEESYGALDELFGRVWFIRVLEVLD